MAKVLFSVICLNAVFSTRSLFVGWNGSKCIRISPWNLKNASQKTVQQMFKFIATWPLKGNTTILLSLMAIFKSFTMRYYMKLFYPTSFSKNHWQNVFHLTRVTDSTLTTCLKNKNKIWSLCLLQFKESDENYL